MSDKQNSPSLQKLTLDYADLLVRRGDHECRSSEAPGLTDWRKRGKFARGQQCLAIADELRRMVAGLPAPVTERDVKPDKQNSPRATRHCPQYVADDNDGLHCVRCHQLAADHGDVYEDGTPRPGMPEHCDRCLAWTVYCRCSIGRDVKPDKQNSPTIDTPCPSCGCGECTDGACTDAYCPRCTGEYCDLHIDGCDCDVEKRHQAAHASKTVSNYSENYSEPTKPETSNSPDDETSLPAFGIWLLKVLAGRRKLRDRIKHEAPTATYRIAYQDGYGDAVEDTIVQYDRLPTPVSQTVSNYSENYSEPTKPETSNSPPIETTIRRNAEIDASYCPYCMRCNRLVRMAKVEPMYWRCACGAEHDLRDPNETTQVVHTLVTTVVTPPEKSPTIPALRNGVSTRNGGDDEWTAERIAAWLRHNANAGGGLLSAEYLNRYRIAACFVDAVAELRGEVGGLEDEIAGILSHREQVCNAMCESQWQTANGQKHHTLCQVLRTLGEGSS